jgi:hypothetical protein
MICVGKNSEEPGRMRRFSYIQHERLERFVNTGLEWKKKPLKGPGEDLRRQLAGCGYGRK